jgi:DNA-binding MarR family transcriptional regulator
LNDLRKLEVSARQIAACLQTLNHRLFLVRIHRLQGELRAKEWEALAALKFRGCLMMGDLANALGVALSSATRTVDSLVKKELVTRSRIDDDRRVVRVDLNKNGRKHEAAIWRERVAMGRDMLAPLSPDERKIFVELIEKMARLARPSFDTTATDQSQHEGLKSSLPTSEGTLSTVSNRTNRRQK